MKTMLMFAAAVLSFAVSGGVLTDKISEKCKVIAVDKFHGFDRTRFEFQGCEAWVVEPEIPALKDRPWTWTMQWATAFVPRTPALHLLRRGWHHVTIMTFDHRMNDKGIAISKAFHEFLVDELAFAPKACLIGLSWGGFFSTRYAEANLGKVAAIYYDCPLLNFDEFMGLPPEKVPPLIGPWGGSVPEKWSDDPRMPVNMADAVAKAGIPVYLVYGAADRVVLPHVNCELFAEKFKAAGGKITVVKRNAYGHHPHGVEVDDLTIADFFRNAVK